VPKAILEEKLEQMEGYPARKARKVVAQVIEVLKAQLKAGKNIEIEGLGILSVVRRPSERRIVANLRHQGPSVRQVPTHPKTVKLRSKRDFTLGK
jgi:nucleoid DNA-binding protein